LRLSHFIDNCLTDGDEVLQEKRKLNEQKDMDWIHVAQDSVMALTNIAMNLHIPQR
jgi:hypothetical protein